MNEFEQLVQTSYRALLDISAALHDKGIFSLMFEQLPATVADKETLQQIEIDELFKAMNHTRTITGAATLYRSLMQPLTSLELILAKQESLRELESNDGLREAVVEYLEEVKKREHGSNGEEALYCFLNAEDLDYGSFKAAMKAGAKLADAAKQIPKPESRYLDVLVSSLQSWGNTENYRLMRGPIYRTFKGLKSKEDIRFKFLPYHWKFSPAYITFLPTILGAGGSLSLVLFMADVATDIPPLMKTIERYTFWAFPLMMPPIPPILAYILIVKPSIDKATVFKPLLKRILADPEFYLAVDSFGKLDELVSFYEYAKAMPGNMALPGMEDADSHYFRARNLRNPILGKGNPDYVPNDVYLDGCKLTFVTGPNSGGKTTLVKTIAQIQLMAQIGSYIPADGAEISAADRIFYQYYQPDRLQSSQGDFGVNLARTRDIFYAATPRSLVVLNVLASGTTSHEELEQAYGILNDFAIIGNNTIYVTHRYEVAERLQRGGLGQFLQTYFVYDEPTFKFVPGISRESHAAKIAEKIGFSPENRKTHLINMGYLKK